MRIPDGAARSWPCGRCGTQDERGPVWDAGAGGWRCLACGRFEPDDALSGQASLKLAAGFALLVAVGVAFLLAAVLLRAAGLLPY